MAEAPTGTSEPRGEITETEETTARIADIDAQLEDIRKKKKQVTTEKGVFKVKEPQEPPPALSVIRADELVKMDIEQPFFIVKDILPVGLTVVASPPKYGKSWWVLDLSTSVAMGRPFLGYDTNKCHTLYLALEDSEARLKSRLTKILRGRGAPPAGCAITTHSMDIEHGLTQQIVDAINNDPELRLIVIDTFQKIRSGSKSNESAYAADYREVGAIKEIADKYKVGVVLVTHVRKMKDPSDPYNNITGTAGISGAADTMIVLNRDTRTDENTVMSITGRDVESNEWYITFDKGTCRWRMRGTCDDILADQARNDYNKNPFVITIKKLLEENPEEGWMGTASEFIQESRRFRVYLNISPQSLKSNLDKIRYYLEDNDNISWDMVRNNGRGGAKHYFHYSYNPFTDAENRDSGELGETQENE